MKRQTYDSMTIYPVSLDQVLEAIGEADTLKLVQLLGGTTQRLPSTRNISTDHKIAQIIGQPALQKLVAAVGAARYVYLPRCADGLRQLRDRQIVRQYSEGAPVEQLALENGLSDRQIWAILKKTDMEDNQESLF